MSELINYQTVRFVPTNCYSPNHWMVKYLYFPFDPEKEGSEATAIKEANLANAMAQVGELNGLSPNEIRCLFPAILRMLKSNSDWTK